jgi:hypothetical protein
VWVEAYVAPYGWLGFDPTPRDFSDSANGSSMFKHFSELTDYLNLEWSRYILNYDMQRQLSIVKNFTETSHRMSWRLDRVMAWLQNRTFPRPKSSVVSNGVGRSGGSGFLYGLVLAVLVGGGVAWHRRRRYQVWFYPRLVRFLKKKGAPGKDSSTLHELIDSVRSNLGANLPHVEFLKDVYYRLRFHSISSLTSTEQQQIKIALNALR